MSVDKYISEALKEIKVPRIKDKANLKKTVKLFATCAYNNNTDKILINIIKIIGPEPEWKKFAKTIADNTK